MLFEKYFDVYVDEENMNVRACNREFFEFFNSDSRSWKTPLSREFVHLSMQFFLSLPLQSKFSYAQNFFMRLNSFRCRRRRSLWITITTYKFVHRNEHLFFFVLSHLYDGVTSHSSMHRTSLIRMKKTMPPWFKKPRRSPRGVYNAPW